MVTALGKVNRKWSKDLSYAVGLITSDGNLSPDGRHINFTTKDLDLAQNFKTALKLNNKIGRKARGGSTEKKYFVVQFGDKRFYEFLLSIGLLPNKSKTLSELKIPNEFFGDFLRGCIDGDGGISAFSHPESRNRQLRVRIASASPLFLDWLRIKIKEIIKTEGGWISKVPRAQQLCFGIADSRKIINFMYNDGECLALERKRGIYRKYMGEWRNW